MRAGRRSWARRLIWFTTGGLVLLVALYVYLTRPDRLRARALEALASLAGEDASVADVAYTPWGGLQLLDLRVGPTRAAAATCGPARYGPFAALRAAHVRIHCDVAGLLRGRLRARDIAVEGLELRILGDPDASSRGLGSAARPTGRSWQLPGGLDTPLPRIRVDQADVQVWAARAEGARLLRRWLVRGIGSPTDEGYQLEIRPSGGLAPPLAQLNWNRPRHEIEVALDWLDMETVALLLPEAWADVGSDWDLRGDLRVERALLGTTKTADWGGRHIGLDLRHAALRFSKLRGSVPVEQAEPAVVAGGPADRFLQFRDMDMTARFEAVAPGDSLVTCEGTGELNEAAAKFRLTTRTAALASSGRAADHLLSAELHVAGLAFPSPEAHGAFVRSGVLPSAVRSFFREYQPRGRLNFWLRAERTPSSVRGTATTPVLAYEGELEPLGASCRYGRFPYDFTEAHGRVRFSNAGIQLDGVTGRHGSGLVRADGLVHSSRANAGFDLTFHGTNVPLDADLFVALPPSYQEIWQRAAPLGTCDALVVIGRTDAAPTGPAAPLDVQMDARLLGGSVLVKPGQRLQGAAGTIGITHGAFELRELTGHLNGGALRIRGTIGSDDGPPPQTDVLVEMADAPVQRPADGGAAVRFAGHVDAWGRVRGAGSAEAPAEQYVVRVKDGVLGCGDTTDVWEPCAGWARLTGARTDVLAFTAWQQAARLSARGTVPGTESPGSPAALDLRIDDATMERLVPQFAALDRARFAERLGLSGKGALHLQLRPQTASREPAQPDVVLEFTSERMKPARLPLDLRAAEVHARISGSAVEVSRATAGYGEQGRIRGSGRYEWTADAARGDFQLSAEELTITRDLIAALPAPLRRLLERVSPRGRLRIELTRLQLFGGREQTWQGAGWLDVAEGQLDLGLSLTQFDGRLSGSGTVYPNQQTDWQAAFSVARGQLAGRPIADWAGQLRRQAGQRWLYVEDLRGRLCDGDMLASARFDPDTSEYELSLTLRNAHFAALLPRRNPTLEAVTDGQADGNLLLRGVAGDSSTRNGAGQLRIRGAAMFQTPVLAQMAQLGPAARQQFDERADALELRFVWQGALLTLTSVEMQSRDVRLIGEGTWNLKTDELELALLAAHPRHWPRLAGLTDLIEKAGQELVQYRVSGTLAGPRVTIEPLYRVTATLRALVRSSELKVKN